MRIPLSFRGRPKPRGQKNAKIVFLALDNVRVRAIFSIVFYCNKLFNHFLLKNGESEVNMDSFLSVDGFSGLFGGLGSLFGGDYGYYDYGYNDYGYYDDYDLSFSVGELGGLFGGLFDDLGYLFGDTATMTIIPSTIIPTTTTRLAAMLTM